MLCWRAHHVMLARLEYGSSTLCKEGALTGITGVHPCPSLREPIHSQMEDKYHEDIHHRYPCCFDPVILRYLLSRFMQRPNRSEGKL